eukprot:3939460-Rhodomonas_salina.5
MSSGAASSRTPRACRRCHTLAQIISMSMTIMKRSRVSVSDHADDHGDDDDEEEEEVLNTDMMSMMRKTRWSLPLRDWDRVALPDLMMMMMRRRRMRMMMRMMMIVTRPFASIAPS